MLINKGLLEKSGIPIFDETNRQLVIVVLQGSLEPQSFTRFGGPQVEKVTHPAFL